MRSAATGNSFQYFRIIFFALLCGAVLAGLVFTAQKIWVWMQKPTSFPIEKIAVHGKLTHVSAKEMQTIVEKNLSGGFFSLHVSKTKQLILQKPWVSDVSFRRVWPSELVVLLTEQVPVARFGENGVVNNDNVVFYPDPKTIPTDLPVLHGAQDAMPLLIGYLQSFNALLKNLQLTVTTLSLSKSGSVSAELSNHIVVTAGRDDVLSRFQRFAHAYPNIVKSSAKPIATVDLRYPDGVAVGYGITTRQSPPEHRAIAR